MKTDLPQAVKLIEQLRGTKLGGSFKLSSPMPGVDVTETQAFVREVQTDFWVLDLMWNGILYAEVTAQVLENELLLEVL